MATMTSAGIFAAEYDFELDQFQLDGISALSQGRSALVCAPTGAGKTVVGEYAVWRALQTDGKCFYTTPIKALSNQKFADLVERHSAEQVGLLTGDRVVNGDADIVVMTTEVLRNMLYEGSRTLDGLQAVVLDEVHYLADRSRGAVWEEVIIQLPPDVQLACLSATVSNAEEFGTWLRSVRPGVVPTDEAEAADQPVEPHDEESAADERASSVDVVISEFRPVPLEHHYAVNDRMYDTFRAGHRTSGKKHDPEKVQAAKQAKGGVPNPEVVMLERRAGSAGRPRKGGRGPRGGGVRLRAPRRSELIRNLRQRRMLPAIYFLFSRNGCDDAVKQVVGDGVRLTSGKEQQAIRRLVAERTAELPADDLDALNFHAWRAALEHGVAAHHAGLVPLFKEIVEALFVRGLVKVCFATETLALGINMPARTVVIERLEKWDGQAHRLLTPGQFTQLTGRAGRRGLDSVGHAVVAYQRNVDFPTVASLVGRRTEPLQSSFAPSYNMAINLLRRHDRAEAQGLLARSFAQFQADQRVIDVEQSISRNSDALSGYARNLHSQVGDFAEYWALRRETSRLESAAKSERARQKEEAINERLASLAEGDVIALTKGSHPDLGAVVSTSVSSAGAPLARVVTADRKVTRVGPREFDRPPTIVTRISLPGSGSPRQAAWRKRVSAELRAVPPHVKQPRVQAPGPDPDTAERIAGLREQIREHPVHSDPQLPEIEVWAHRYDELAAKTEKLQQQVRRRTGSLVRSFGRITDLLADLEYVTEDPDDPEPTEHGMLLAQLYAETDLVLTESLRDGAFDGLAVPELAALASVFVHETRLKFPPPPELLTDQLRERFTACEKRWSALVHREEQVGLTPTRPLDAGFAGIVYRWAEGADLDTALGMSELTAGDFVRNVKQVADLLRQLRDAEPGGGLATQCHRASKTLLRGVVAFEG